MNKNKLSLFKVQKSLNGETILIYNKKKTKMGEVPYNHELDDVFKDKNKIYVLGKVDNDGRIKIVQRVKDRAW
ncbi:hypothetical protein [Anaerorhabdus sp.]|uniref:hypothetical protein n=1 Tax=Anaerorhabdus sp. TaxID=1872524 RepID=UPI002FC61045